MSWAALAAFLLAYLAGSLPFGLIVARLFGGIDIRKEGSGNIGATNVARVLGAKYGAFVLSLDCVKGAAPTGLLPVLLLSSDLPQRVHLAVLSGVAAILGHMFPCWLGFRGGKGVATALGVALVLAPGVGRRAVRLCLQHGRDADRLALVDDRCVPLLRRRDVVVEPGTLWRGDVEPRALRAPWCRS